MQPYVYQVTKDEALDLPRKIYETRYFSRTAEQSALYEQAKEELLMRVDPYEIRSHAIFRLFTALQQITCGFWNRRVPTDDIVDEWGVIRWPRDMTGIPVEYHYPEHGRLRLLQKVLEEITNRGGEDEKVIIWARYHVCIREIACMLGTTYGAESFSELHGGLSETKRTAELDAWRADRRFLIATPETGSHGLTLTEARYAVFYNNTFNYADRLQAEDRTHRIGQDRRPTYIDLVCSDSIDERIQEAIASKESVLKAFRRRIEAVKAEKQGAMDELARTL
jgi:SNF2 family DNA or RNA helicase